MRLLGLGLLVLLAAIPEVVSARAAYAPVQVTLTVDDSCRIETPSHADPSTLTATSEIALLPDCRPGVPPLLTLANDSVKGAYVATIDF